MQWDRIPAAPITYSLGNLSTCHINIMSDYLIAHIKWLEDRLNNEAMDDFTRSQVLSALLLARGY